VNNLTIEVPAGSIFGFLGPNGSGKTTTIRMLLGLIEPTAGHAEVLGFDVSKSADQIRQRSGVLLEYSCLYERFTAEENLELFARIWNIPRRERRARIEQLLRDLRLWDRRRDRVGSWSHGMKRKLAFARALLHRPALLFLDEPTSGLDAIAAAALREELASLAGSTGVTIFLTTHNLAEAEKLCAQVAIIHDGRLLAAGSPKDLRVRGASHRTEIAGRGLTAEVASIIRGLAEVRSAVLENGQLMIELHDPSGVTRIVPVLVAAGVEIEGIHKSTSNLEEVFLSLVGEQE
jgi:ABC-2 type transport system ATP-binding protein